MAEPTPASCSAPPPDRRPRGAWRWLVASILILAAGSGGALYAWHSFTKPGPLAEAKPIVIPRGTLESVAQTLSAADAIAEPLAFRLAALATGREGALRAGEFAFPEAASLRQVLTVLRTARPVQHRLTIPEGLTAAQIAALMGRADALSGPVPAFQEGALLPDTYAFERGTPAATVVERARVAMDRVLQAAWRDRAEGLPLSSPREALILASIVERETARPEERPRVAAVFLNRLRLGMKLQSDPTAAYAATAGAVALDRPLTRADLDRDHPFNTYRISGLPPGPICAPGADAIRAVLRPAEADDLYFVADGTGGHAFARTLQEHLRNVARWRAISPG